MTVPESLLVAVLGGLFALMLQQARDWLLGPRLKVTWDRRAGGCVVDTDQGNPSTHEPTGKGRYLRLRIDNDGRSTARNVCVSIVKITRRIPGSGEDSFDEEVMDLTYPFGTPTGRVTRADLPPKTHRFINLCHTIVELDGGHRFDFDVWPIPIRLIPKYQKSVAHFDVELMIAADNFTGCRIKRVSVLSGGTIDSLNLQ
jgi:hypothetical protein